MADETETEGTETGLAKIIPTDLEGGSLIKAAQAENRKWLQKEVVQRVQELLHNLRVQRDYLESTKSNIALLEKKLAAIEAGEFAANLRGRITFSDSALQQEVIAMKECINCGYGKK